MEFAISFYFWSIVAFFIILSSGGFILLHAVTTSSRTWRIIRYYLCEGERWTNKDVEGGRLVLEVILYSAHFILRNGLDLDAHPPLGELWKSSKHLPSFVILPMKVIARVPTSSFRVCKWWWSQASQITKLFVGFLVRKERVCLHTFKLVVVLFFWCWWRSGKKILFQRTDLWQKTTPTICLVGTF